MKISKRIKIGNNDYYIIVDVEYRKIGDKFPSLYLKNYKDEHWDGGDCSILIEEVEKQYTSEKAKHYDEHIGFMADVLYIYDRIPFISGIKDIYISKNDNIPYSEGYIKKEEIDKHIKEFNIKMNSNPNFKLNDGRTWKL